jgi:hypothetical protein
LKALSKNMAFTGKNSQYEAYHHSKQNAERKPGRIRKKYTAAPRL